MRASEQFFFLSFSTDNELRKSLFAFKLVHVPSPHSGWLLPLWYRFRSRHRPPPAALRPRSQHRTPLDPGEFTRRAGSERRFLFCFVFLTIPFFFFQFVDAPTACSLLLRPAVLSRSRVVLPCVLPQGAPGPKVDAAAGSEQAPRLQRESALSFLFLAPLPADGGATREREQSHGDGFSSATSASLFPSARAASRSAPAPYGLAV